MIRDPEQHQRALRAVAELERRIKAGTATEAERERYRAGCDHVLIFEWAEEGRAIRERKETR